MAINLVLDESVSNYAVFGNPIKHSKSPQIQTLFAEQTGIRLVYQAIEVPKDFFKEYIDEFFSQSGRGLNITVPFKEDAFSLCLNLTERARYAESVNTIWFDKESGIYGDTTDGTGLINDLTLNNDIYIENKSVLILGAGGTVKAILKPLCEQRPSRIVIVNRTLSRAEELAEKFSTDITIEACSYNQLSKNKFDLIINATSLSLEGKLPPVPDSILSPYTCCYDLMYADKPTIFMQWAKEQGANKVLDGLGMLVEQAAEGFLVWHGVRPETKPVMQKLRKYTRDTWKCVF